MANIDSRYITVFPSTKRGSFQRSARLFSEENIVNLATTLAESYVMNFDTTTQVISFIIHGYRFTIDLSKNDLISEFQNSTELYAYIKLESTAVEQNNANEIVEYYWELAGQDDMSTNTYLGITLVDTQPNFVDTINEKYFWLKLLVNDTTPSSSFSDWIVPESSFARIPLEEIQGTIESINCGYIEDRI